MRAKVKLMREKKKEREREMGTEVMVTRKPSRELQEVSKVIVPSFSLEYGLSMISCRR